MFCIISKLPGNCHGFLGIRVVEVSMASFAAMQSMAPHSIFTSWARAHLQHRRPFLSPSLPLKGGRRRWSLNFWWIRCLRALIHPTPLCIFVVQSGALGRWPAYAYFPVCRDDETALPCIDDLGGEQVLHTFDD